LAQEFQELCSPGLVALSVGLGAVVVSGSRAPGALAVLFTLGIPALRALPEGNHGLLQSA